MNGVEKGRESSAFGLVSDRPIIPFVEGDGTGPDIWKASRRVFDAAVSRAYGGTRAVQWREVLAGEKGFRETGSWLPDETVESFRMHRIGIKGPLTTPVGEGIRSLNVALRQTLDLYVCLRPVRYFQGIVSPVVHPERVDMVVFRENTEDVYAGMEVPAGDERTDRISAFLKSEMGWNIGPDTGIGIKPVSRGGSERLIRAAIKYALACGRKSVTLVHKGNIMKYTEGAFMRWGYELAQREFPGKVRLPEGREGTGNSGEGDLVIKDVIADAFLQQILTRPEEYDVIATLNLNGDYISDALAAQVGGIGIAPGANINYDTGTAIFEATHGTAPKYAGKDMANPSSLILSGKMMFEYIGWTEAASLIEKGMASAFLRGRVTYDLARLMPGTAPLSTSGFAEEIVSSM